MRTRPQTKPPAAAVPEQLIREQLETILAHDIFVKSARLCDLLRFIVNEVLKGNAEGIKEQVILCEVFGADDGPELNTVVRTSARRLRDKLREFYGEKAEQRVLIALPKGTYVPAFELLRTRPAGALLEGTWNADVTYENAYMTFPRYQKCQEVFTFEVDGEQLLGSATFKGAIRALFDGKFNGDRLNFITKSPQVSDSSKEPAIARYRGKLLEDKIRFVLVVEGGHYADSPVEFTAIRMREA